MGNMRDTQYFQTVQDKKMEVSDVLEQVYVALTEKGYNPVNQIVGYIMSGDPTYITSHKGARSLIMKVERDEILVELMKNSVEPRLRSRVEKREAEPAGGISWDSAPLWRYIQLIYGKPRRQRMRKRNRIYRNRELALRQLVL